MSLILNNAQLSQAFSLKATVRAATIAAGTLATSFEAGDAIDGVTLVAGDRILIKNQGTGSENGIYVVEATGTPTRAFDLESGVSANGVFVWIEEGTVNANTGHICTSATGSDVVGTDALAFTQFDVVKTLTVTRGGTGQASLTANRVLVGNGTSAVDLSKTAPTGDFVGTTDTQVLSGKTLTLPEINDTSADHQYVFAVNELTADRTITLPLLTGNDTFVFESHTQNLSNKTLITPSIQDSGTDHNYNVAVSDLAADRTITLPLLTGNDTFVFETHTQQLSNKTLVTPSILDSGTDHSYDIAVSNLAANRTVTLPLLTGNDTFVFEAHTQTLTNKTLTSPAIGTSILDTNGNELFLLTATGSAVNEFTIANSATGVGPTLSSTGNDANIDINISPKGTGVISASSSRITNVSDPTGNTDAANKQYVDTVAAGLDPKESCRVATTADLAATYAAGGGAGGTGQFTGAPTTIDGTVIATGDRILVKDQTDAQQNGIYVVTGTTTIWDRASDQDGSPATDVSGGNFTFIEQGSTNIGTGWVVTGNGTLTLNTDDLNWVQFSASTSTTRIAYPVLTLEAAGSSTTYTTVAYFSWVDARYSGYTQGRVIYEATIGNRNLDIRLRDTTNAATIYENTAIAASAFFNEAISANPTANGRIELQVRKAANGGVNPTVTGFQLEFNN